MGAPIHTLKANFNGGEMTPLMAGRFDTDKLPSGCLTMKNFIVRPYGGIFKRPGTQYVGAAKSTGTTRAVSFRRSTSTNYILELGDYYMRMWKGGNSPAQVTVSGVAAWAASTAYAVGALVSNSGTNYYCKVAHTSGGSFSVGSNWYALSGSIYEIPTPWAAADVFGLQYTQINDVMFFTHPSYPSQRLSRYAETNCVLQPVPFTFAPTLDVNTSRASVQIQYTIQPWVNNGTSHAIGDRVLGITAPWVNEVFTCVAVHVPNATYSEPGIGASWKSYWALGASSVLAADWATSTSYSSGTVIRYLQVVYKCTQSHTSSALNQPAVGAYWASYWTISTGDYDNGSLSYNLVATDSTFASSDVGSTWFLQVGGSPQTVQLLLNLGNNVLQTSSRIFIQGDVLLSTAWFSSNAPVGSIYLESSSDGTTWSRAHEWSMTGGGYDANIAHTETAPATGAYYRVSYNVITASGFPLILSPVTPTANLPFVITSYTSATQVSGYAIMPGNQRIPVNAVGAATTLYRKPAFTSATGYPRTVAFHDGRLWFAGTSSNPGRIWASDSDDYYDFINGTLATSCIDVTLGAQESNQIMWMKSRGKKLVIGTSGEEWTIDSGDTDVVLTNTNIRAKRYTNYGSAGLAAELIADALLWVARGGRRVHEFSYQFATDSFVAPDMTVVAEHITQGGIVQMAFQASPDPTLWCVMGNGSLAGFSYSREQNITAWHRHATGEDAGDTFQSVASIYGTGVSDEIWFIVKRTINGSTVQYFERFDPSVFQWNTEQGDSMDGRAWVDCAIPGALGSTVVNLGGNCALSGFTALNGRSVRMLAGTASPTSAAAISAGAATFNGFTATGTTPIIGLPVISLIQPMPLEMQLQDGTAQGRHWRPNRLQFIFSQAAGGGYADNPTGPFDAIVYPPGSSVPYTGRVREHIDAQWVDEITIAIQHSDPYPFGMLAYIMSGEVSGE
jgi:hypothetical protein